MEYNVIQSAKQISQSGLKYAWGLVMNTIDMKHNWHKKSDTVKRKEKVLYFFFVAGLTAIYVTYVPCLMDYYIIRQEHSYFSFFSENFLKAPYLFEGIVIGMALAAIYCLTMRAGVSMLIVSAFLFILTHASYIKFINRKELLKLDDLRLTEAAGMVLDYFRFELNCRLVMLAGMFVLFSGTGFALDWFRKRIWKVRETVREAHPEKRAIVGETGRKQRAIVGETRRKKRAIVGETWWKKREDVGEMYTESEIDRGVWKEDETDREGVEGICLCRCHGVAVCARVLGCVCLCIVLVLYTDHFLGERYVIDVIEPLIPETDRYVLYRFLQNDSLSTINVERVEESYDFLLSQEPPKEAANREDYPNVIVIMNESWWNTDNIQTDRITFSKDPMGPYKDLADRCSTGYLTSVVFGGGTVTPEIEFLTGLNAKYYRADSAYAQIQGRKIPSLVDYFNGLDYETVAIHPYYGRFYGRDAAYATMEFDRVIFEEDMRYKDIYTRYISDESLAKQIIMEAERENGGSKFIWALSIANHIRVLDYTAEPAVDFDYPITLKVKDAELAAEEYDTLINYVNGIYLANQAFLQLVDYFSGVDQPTVILMFGDHCPFFSTDVLAIFGLDETGSDGETVKSLYSTPVILWSNFSGEKLNFSGESMYYLPQALIDYAGLPDSDMTRILRYERSYFKTNSPKIVQSTAGVDLHECTMEQLRVLNHCKAVQYDILHGEGIGGDVWQPITGEP